MFPPHECDNRSQLGEEELVKADDFGSTLTLKGLGASIRVAKPQGAHVPLAIEPELIERARTIGSALERLIALVWPEAYRISFGILRDVGLAEDTAQEACAAIARSLPALKQPEVFPAWSYKIIVNRALSAARGRSHAQPLDSLAEHSTATDHSDALDLRRALRALPPVQRAVIILHYYVGLNSSEIAAATNLGSSTIRFHLMVARRALRKALSTEVLSDVS